MLAVGPPPPSIRAVLPPGANQKPAPELAKVAFLSGDWVHDETYQVSPIGAAGKGAGRSRNQCSRGPHPRSRRLSRPPSRMIP